MREVNSDDDMDEDRDDNDERYEDWLEKELGMLKVEDDIRRKVRNKTTLLTLVDEVYHLGLPPLRGDVGKIMYFLKMKDNFNFLIKIEDNLNFK